MVKVGFLRNTLPMALGTPNCDGARASAVDTKERDDCGEFGMGGQNERQRHGYSYRTQWRPSEAFEQGNVDKNKLE